MALSSLEKAIILTVSYSNIFEFPLTEDEISRRLISKNRVSLEDVRNELSKLVRKDLIDNKDGCFFIKNTLIADRKERNNFSKNKKREAQNFYNKAKLLPFIKAIAITGSLSVNNAKENDDVDWLIICQNHTLWIVRPLVILLALLYGKRRERDGHHRDNSWCFNMFLTEDTLDVAQQKRSIFSAFEVCQAEFVVDKDSVAEKFLIVNRWANNYLANFYTIRLKESHGYVSNHKMNKQVNFVIKLLNKGLFFIQYHYMKAKITREVVSIDRALFHPRDTKRVVVQKWKKVLKNV